MSMHKWRRGFTLIELVVVISIIALMTAALYANYSAVDNRGKILAVASKLKEDLNLAQTFSLIGQANGQNRAYGWGVYLNRRLNKYIIYSDLNKSSTYDYTTKLLIHGTETVAANKFTDSSLMANLVTVGAAATQTAAVGKPADNTGYWSFSGLVNSYLQVPASASFDYGTQDFAIDFWFKTTPVGDQRALFYEGNGLGQQTIAIYKDASDIIQAKVYDVSGTAYTATSSAPILASTWYHLALTREKNVVRLFINGVVNQSVSMTTAARAALAFPIYLGVEDDGASHLWSGAMDEIRVSLGNGRWFEKFNVPTVMYNGDDENWREIKLPPGIVFDRLYTDSTAVDELNIFFNPSSYLMFANGATPATDATIKFNNAGAAGTGSSADSPKLLKIMPSGLVKWN